MTSGNHWQGGKRGSVGRRRFLATGAAGMLGLAEWLGAACSSGSNTGNRAAVNGAAPAGSAVGATPGVAGAATRGASGTAAAAKARRGGVLLGGLPSDVDNLDPHTFVPSNTEEQLRAIVEPIVGTNPSGGYAADFSLSSSWEQVSPTEFVFALRPGVKFHDGSDLTADVVQWNFQDILDPARNSPRKASFGVLDHMEAIDASHLRLVLKQPTAGFFGDLNHPSAGIISRASFDKLGADGAKSNVVGTGPFKLKAWNRSQSIELDAFPGYWQKAPDGQALPYLSGIRWDIIPDAGVQAEALSGGKVHMLTSNLGLTRDQIDRFSQDKKFVLDRFVGDLVTILYANRTIAPFDEPGGHIGNLQAVWAALDRQKIVDLVHGPGQGLPAYGGVSPTIHKWAYTGDALNVPKGPDLKRAKELLATAGNPNGFDLPVITLDGYDEELQVMQSQLALIGVNVKLQKLDVTTAVNKMWLVDRNLPAFYAGYAQAIDPNLKLSIAHGSKGAYAPEPDSYKANSDYFKATDALLKQANATYDLTQRAAAYRQLEETNGKYAGAIYVMHRATVGGFAATVQGWDHGPDNKKRYHGVWLSA